MQTRTVGLHPCLSDAAGLGLKKRAFLSLFFKFFFFFFTKNFFFRLQFSFAIIVFVSGVQWLDNHTLSNVVLVPTWHHPQLLL